MDFLKELLQIQHQQTLNQVSDTLNLSEFDETAFIEKYNKKNYCLLKVCNCKIRDSRVQIKDLLSSLECDHNPSLRR